MPKNGLVILGLMAVLMGVAVALALSNVGVQAIPIENQPQVVNLPFYATVSYIDVVNQTLQLSIQPGGTYTVNAPLPPGPGYRLEYLSVYFPTPAPSIGVSGNVLKSVNEYGFITSVYSPSGTIVLTNTGQATLNITIVVSSVFVKEIYIPLTGQSITLTAPDYTFQYVTDQYVEVSIPMNAPFAIQDIVMPNGTYFSQLVEEWGGNITSIQLDYKNVKLNMANLPEGNYTILLSQGTQYVMPFSMLVKGTQFYNTTVNPHSQLIITSNNFGIPSGWQLMGYVVTVYTVQPLVVGQAGGRFMVVANRVSPVYTLSQLITVQGVSYILPPFIRFMPLIGIYVVYDTQFKVVNPLNVPLVVEYMPIIYKPIGAWSNGNLVAQVTQQDVSTGMWTSLVVELPEVATITSIVTPGGTVYSQYTSSELPWGSVYRLVSISPNGHEAYIAVSTLGVSEAGTYVVNIKWSPIVVYVHNTLGSPLNAVVEASQGGTTYGTFSTNSSGIALVKVFNPYPINISVLYQGVDVYNIGISTLTLNPIDVEVGAYNVTAYVTGFFNQAIQGANVTLYRLGTGPQYSQLTGSIGSAQFVNVLSGLYQATAKYGRVTYSTFVDVNSDKVIVLKTNILAIVDGFPITVSDAIIGAVGVPSVAAVAYAVAEFVKRRRPVTFEES